MTTTKIGMEWMKIERSIGTNRTSMKRSRMWKNRFHKQMRKDAKNSIRE